jgi:hypothetical protein
MTEKEQKRKERLDETGRLRKAHSALLNKVAAEIPVKVKFTCIDDPKGTYDMIYPAVPGGTKYRLVSGLQYDLPVSMIDHLNSLEVPDPQIEEDPITRQIRPVLDPVTGKAPMRSRFAVIPLKMNMAGNKTSEEKAA